MTIKKLKELRDLLSELLGEWGYSQDSDSVEISNVLEIVVRELNDK